MQEFTKYVKKKAKEKGIPISKLAKELDMSEVYLRHVIAGRRISFPVVAKISKYFKDPTILYVYVDAYVSRKANEKNLKRRYKV